jgi:uncharacterized protein
MKEILPRLLLALAAVFIIVAGVLVISGSAQAPRQVLDNADIRGPVVTVTGSGQASQAPDLASINLGVTTEADTAEEALSVNSAQMQAALQVLLDAGIASEDIRTISVQLHPRFDDPPRPVETRELIGFTAVNIVEIRVRNLDQLGEFLDQVIQAGATNIEQIRFEISDPAELQDRARQAAVDDAMHKANQLATLAGARLGEVVSIEETTRTPRFAEPRVEPVAEAGVPIQPGMQFIDITVHVSWQLID